MGREQHNMNSIVWKTLQLIRGQYDDGGGLFRRIRNRAHGPFPSLKLRDSRLQKWGSAISLWRRKKKTRGTVGFMTQFLKKRFFCSPDPIVWFPNWNGECEKCRGRQNNLEEETKFVPNPMREGGEKEDERNKETLGTLLRKSGNRSPSNANPNKSSGHGITVTPPKNIPLEE